MSVRTTTTGADTAARRATVRTAMNTHITKASACAKGSSASHNATSAA